MEQVIAYGMFPVLGDCPYDKNSLEGKIVAIYRLVGLGEPLEAEKLYQALPPAAGDSVAEDYSIFAKEYMDHYATRWIGGGRLDDSPWSEKADKLDDAMLRQYAEARRVASSESQPIAYDINRAIIFQSSCESFMDTSQLDVDRAANPMMLPDPTKVTGFIQGIDSFFQQVIVTGTSSLAANQLNMIHLYLRGRALQSCGAIQYAVIDFANGKQLAVLANDPHAQIAWDFALGDLNLSPQGDVTTLGYNIGLEGGIRMSLSRGEHPVAANPLDPNQIKLGQSAYQEASTLLQVQPSDMLSFQLALRTAHSRRVTGDLKGAVDGYKQAATLADQNNYPIQAARSRCEAAILEDNYDLFQQEMDKLYGDKDFSGYYSETRLALSWAYRLQYGFGHLEEAERTARMARDSLVNNHVLDRGQAIMTYLATLYLSFGQTDTAVVTCNSCASEIRNKINDLEKDTPNDDASSIQQDKIEWTRLEVVLLTQEVVYESSAGSGGARIWKEEEAKNQQEILLAAQKAGSTNPSNALFEGGQRMASFRSEVSSLIQQFTDVSTFDDDYHALRAKYESEGVPALVLISGDLYASTKSPAILKEGQTALSQITPINDIQAILDRKYSNIDVYKRSEDLQNAVNTYLTALNLADNLNCTDLLSKWTDQLEDAFDKEPLVRVFCHGGIDYDYFTARLSLAQGDASKAVDILKGILSKPGWNVGTVPLRLRCIQSLCDAQIAEKDPSASLTSYIWLREESDYWQMFQRRLNSSAKWSADEARIYTDAAASGGLSDADMAKLQSLMVKSDAARKPAPSEPEWSQIQNLITSRSPTTEILVYRWTSSGLDRWVLSSSAAPTLTHVDISVSDLTEKLLEFQKLGMHNFTQWQSLGKELSDLFFDGLGTFDGKDTVAILAPGILSEMPLDVVAATPQAFRTRTAAFVNLTSFLPDSTVAQGEAAQVSPGAGNVVVAFGGQLTAGEQEAKSIAARFGVNPIVGKEDFLKALPTADYVHMVCHGILNSNPFESYLAMGNERIEAWRLFETAPRSTLIVLSACDTAARDQRDLPFQTDSLSIGALAEDGGSQFLISTLWPVDDQATTPIMEHFYANLQESKCSIPQALHRAITAYSTQNPEAAPYYFAGFSLSARDVGCLPAIPDP